jgi:hypothetical protein
MLHVKKKEQSVSTTKFHDETQDVHLKQGDITTTDAIPG